MSLNHPNLNNSNFNNPNPNPNPNHDHDHVIQDNLTQDNLPQDNLQLAEYLALNDPAVVLATGLALLTPAELVEIQRFFTPRFTELLVKAYGPSIHYVMSAIASQHAENPNRTATNAENPNRTATNAENPNGKNPNNKNSASDDSATENSASDDSATDHADDHAIGHLTATELMARQQEIRALMRDPLYWRYHDKAQIKKVAEAFERLYG